MDLAQDILIVLDTSGNVLDVNDAAVRMHGGKLEDFYGRDVARFLHPKSAEEMLNVALAMYAKGKDNSDRMQLKAFRADGSEVHLDLHVSWSQAEQNFYVVERDVSESVLRTLELEHLSEQLRKLSTTDNLVELPNRLAFDQAMHEIERDDRPAGLAFIDINDFKAVNDSLGHGAGDELLRQISDRLRSVLLEGEFVARIGGDEFGYLIPAIDEVAMQRRLDAIRQATRGELSIAGRPIGVTCAVGMVSRESGESASSWMGRADSAMYKTKAAMRKKRNAA